MSESNKIKSEVKQTYSARLTEDAFSIDVKSNISGGDVYLDFVITEERHKGIHEQKFKISMWNMKHLVSVIDDFKEKHGGIK